MVSLIIKSSKSYNLPFSGQILLSFTSSKKSQPNFSVHINMSKNNTAFESCKLASLNVIYRRNGKLHQKPTLKSSEMLLIK